jgi:hypothetical protein
VQVSHSKLTFSRPQSLLKVTKGIGAPNVRIIRWDESKLGTVIHKISKGLRVQYPGYRITCKDYTDLDGRPQNPWPGVSRIPESCIFFRDVDTGDLSRVTDQRLGYLNTLWKTDEDRVEYNKKELFPLNDVAKTDKSVIILNSQAGSIEGVFAILASPTAENNSESIPPSGSEIDTVRPATKDSSPDTSHLTSYLDTLKIGTDGNNLKIISAPDPVSKEALELSDDGIAVETKMHIMVTPLPPLEAYMYSTIEQLALVLRAESITDRHLQLHAQLERQCYIFGMDLKDRMEKDELFKTSLKELRDRMKEMVREVVRVDEKFVQSVEKYYGVSFLEMVWVNIRDYFFHCYVGKRMKEDQVWFVD